MLIFCSSIIVGFSFVFLLISQPLRMGFFLLLSTVFVCFYISILLSSWIGYVLFLVYVGGLLVMFGYVAVCSPNVLYKIDVRFWWVSLICVGIFCVFLRFWIIKEFVLSGGCDNLNVDFFGGVSFVLYSGGTFFVVIILGLILLLALVIVVKICYFLRGPLRPFF